MRVITVVTITVRWERQTWGHYEAVSGEGRRGQSQSSLAILNILWHIIMVWLGKMNRGGTGWVHLYVCVQMCVWVRFPFAAQHHVCLIITPQSFLAPLSSSVPRSCSFHPSFSSLRVQLRTKHILTRGECGAQRTGSNSHHNYTQLLPHCLFYPRSPSFPTRFPRNIFALFFSSVNNLTVSPSLSTLHVFLSLLAAN